MGQWIGLYVGNKKGHILEGMRPEKSRYHCAASLRWYYPGQVRGSSNMAWTSQRKRSPSLVKAMLTLNLYLVNEPRGPVL